MRFSLTCSCQWIWKNHEKVYSWPVHLQQLNYPSSFRFWHCLWDWDRVAPSRTTLLDYSGLIMASLTGYKTNARKNGPVWFPKKSHRAARRNTDPQILADLNGFTPWNKNFEFSFVALIYFVPRKPSVEKLIKYQGSSSWVIMSVILMTTLFYKALILQGEIWN